jgi:hypothetical protein
MLVLVKDAAEAVVSVDVQVGEPVRVGDRFGHRGLWACDGNALVRSVSVVEDFVLAQRVQQVSLIENQRPVEQFAAAGPHPALHHRVHPGHSDAAEHDRDASVGEDGVE